MLCYYKSLKCLSNSPVSVRMRQMSSHTEEGFTIEFGCNMRAKLSDDDCAQSRELKFVVKVVPDDIVVAFVIDIFRLSGPLANSTASYKRLQLELSSHSFT